MPLNILLLEDDPAKKNRLLDFINSKTGDLFGSVDTALSVNDALAKLSNREYDLLIVDIIVPAVWGGEAHESHSISLFTQIDEGVSIRRPRYALAISASDQLSAAAKEYFVGRPWGILNYSESSDECIATIEKICRYILARRNEAEQPRRCDIFIFTALMEPEFQALEAASVEWSPLEPLDEMQFVRYGRISLDSGEKTIAAAFAPRMGAVASAVLVSKVVLKLSPRILIMCGICAGLEGKAAIGDVIAAEISWDWQSGKYTDKEGVEHFEIGPHQISVDEQTRSQLLLLKRDRAFWTSLGQVSARYRQSAPNLVVGPVATGSAVLADARVSERIKATQHRNLAGLDMEVYGAYAAASACDPSLRYLALKAVCDYGDRTKDDQYQSYASEISVLAAMHFVKHYADPLLK
jgi:nucleoside phosphorylase